MRGGIRVERSYLRRDVYESTQTKESVPCEHVASEDLEVIAQDNAALQDSIEKEYKVLLQTRDDMADRIEKVEVGVAAQRNA